MKRINKIILALIPVAIIAAAFFVMPAAKANANTEFNTNPQDFPTTSVSNYSQNPGCTNCWYSDVTMQAGQVASVRVYYHNTGSQTAVDTRIRISPKSEPAVNHKMMAGGVWASNASLKLGYGTIHITGTPQTITYIPGTAAWFAEHSLTPQYLSPAQEAALFSPSGVSIGNILPDSTCPITQTFCHQGSLVARFQIGSATPPPPPPVVYACSDHQDNDGDGLVDYPADPGCFGPTDNDEYNQVIPPPPQAYVTASTQPATNISQTSANLNGSFATNQSQTSVWFEWGSSQSLGNLTVQQSMPGSSGNFSSFISNLTPNTTYYFKACADTAATSPSCGAILSFTTSQQIYNAPTVVTIAGNCSATQNTFMAFGSFTSNSAGQTTTWFQYGLSPNSLGNQAGNQTQYASSGNFNTLIGGLQANTTYNFQAVAQNQGGTAYGTILSCTTQPSIVIPPSNPLPPQVTTVPASNVAQTSARINGYLASTGMPPTPVCVTHPCPQYMPPHTQTSVWFEWGPTPALGLSTPQQSFIYPSHFNQFLQNLQPGKRYFFRAVAQNNLGTVFGQTLFFDTAESGQGPKVIYVNTHTGSGQIMKIEITSDAMGACVGDSIYYTVNYENLSKKNLKDVVVQVIMPREETFIRASRGSFSENANTVTVDVGNVMAREKGSFSIEVDINGRTGDDDTLVATGTAVYTLPNGSQGDAIGYSMIDVTCGSGFTLFGDCISCWFWILLALIILLAAIFATRRRY